MYKIIKSVEYLRNHLYRTRCQCTHLQGRFPRPRLNFRILCVFFRINDYNFNLFNFGSLQIANHTFLKILNYLFHQSYLFTFNRAFFRTFRRTDHLNLFPNPFPTSTHLHQNFYFISCTVQLRYFIYHLSLKKPYFM
jgi:hypothetical protein